MNPQIAEMIERLDAMGAKSVMIWADDTPCVDSGVFCKHHNANCGPFNRALKKLIDEAER
jgi:hypothetical protein